MSGLNSLNVSFPDVEETIARSRLAIQQTKELTAKPSQRSDLLSERTYVSPRNETTLLQVENSLLKQELANLQREIASPAALTSAVDVLKAEVASKSAQVTELSHKLTLLSKENHSLKASVEGFRHIKSVLEQ